MNHLYAYPAHCFPKCPTAWLTVVPCNESSQYTKNEHTKKQSRPSIGLAKDKERLCTMTIPHRLLGIVNHALCVITSLTALLRSQLDTRGNTLAPEPLPRTKLSRIHRQTDRLTPQPLPSLAAGIPQLFTDIYRYRYNYSYNCNYM